jgi:multiple sugar transport system permease protein
MSQSIGTKNQLAYLSVPAVAFTLALIAFPFGYTVWMSLHEFSFGGTAKMNYGHNYVQMLGDGSSTG